MAKRRTEEELHEIYLKCAETLETEGEKAVLDYLESENYRTPKSTWFYFQRSEDYKKAEKEYKAAKRAAKKQETVVLDGVEYTKAEQNELTAQQHEETRDDKFQEDDLEQGEEIIGKFLQEGQEEQPEEIVEETHTEEAVEEETPEEKAEEPKTETVAEMLAEKKPPIGLMPRTVWMENRVTEIMQAMWRYIEARQQIPTAWYVELNQLITFLRVEEGDE